MTQLCRSCHKKFDKADTSKAREALAKNMQKQNWQARISPTLGDLESTHDKIWGTKPYENDTDPTVFMGIYGLPDFYTLWRHKGEKHILWCGTDIIHFQNGYWLDTKGDYRIGSRSLARWINKFCSNWVENKVEAEALMKEGIHANIQPSYLGDIDEMQVSFKPGNKVYASVSGDNFEQYGWDKIPNLARENPGMEFHLYGNMLSPLSLAVELDTDKFRVRHFPENVIIHGRVPKEQMNAEIAEMQGGLRMTEFDGASEIVVKAMLMGQYCFSLIEYPFVDKPENISLLLSRKTANIEGRNWWRENLNLYPWNAKRNIHKNKASLEQDKSL